jgi:hypothetical protein
MPITCKGRCEERASVCIVPRHTIWSSIYILSIDETWDDKVHSRGGPVVELGGTNSAYE